MNNALQWDSSETLNEIRARFRRDRSNRVILLTRVMAGVSLDGSETEPGDPDPPYTLEAIRPVLEQIAGWLMMAYTFGCGDFDTIEELIRKSLLASIDWSEYKAARIIFREAMERVQREARRLYPNGAPLVQKTAAVREEMKRLKQGIKDKEREGKQVLKRPVGRPPLPDEEHMRRAAKKSEVKAARQSLRESFQQVNALIDAHVQQYASKIRAAAREEYEIALSGGLDLSDARAKGVRWLRDLRAEWGMVETSVEVPKDGPSTQGPSLVESGS